VSEREGKRVQVQYGGPVQGVGFRYTAENIARKFGVTGYVRNLPNGRVEMVAEGEERTLKSLLEAIESSELGRSIRTVNAEWFQAEDTFSDFRITY